MNQIELAVLLEEADKVIKNGSYWLLGGGLITLGTYASADPGGSYMVFWGPAAYGALRMYKGYRAKSEILKAIKNSSH
jgi:hypothetical protein